MKIKGLLTIFAAILITWQFLIPFVNSLKFPIRQTHGIISAVVLLGRSPATNIALYLILLLLPCLVVMFLEPAKSWFEKILSTSSPVSVTKDKLYSFFSAGWVLPTLCIVVVASWVASRTPFSDLQSAAAIARDPFHFGEKIGLTEAFIDSPKAFFDKQYLMIHGFGLNILPDVLSSRIVGIDHDLSLTAIIIHFQFLIPVIASFLVLFEISNYLAKEHQWKFFSILCLLYFAFHGSVFGIIDREAVFFVQLFIVLRWIRLISFNNPSDSDEKLSFGSLCSVYPILLGVSLPACILFVYDRAVYFIVILVALFFYLLIVKGIRFALYSFSLVLLSTAGTAIVLSLFLGFSAIPESLRQILYWSKVSGLFTSLPYPSVVVSTDKLMVWVPIFLQSSTLILLYLRLRTYCFVRREKFSYFLSVHSVPLFLLLSAVLFMRVALGRSDEGHLISPGFFSVFAFASTVGLVFHNELHKVLNDSWRYLFLTAFVFASLLNMSSVFASLNLSALIRYPSNLAALAALDNSSFTKQMLPQSYIKAAEQIKPELGEQSCFYSLTSEGLWYRILSMRPCSKYWYLIYATTTDTQRDLISELRQTKPNIILYSTNFASSLDGVQREVSHLRVHQYIWRNYRPYKLIDGHWFWKRRERALELSDFKPEVQDGSPIGYFDRISIEPQNYLPDRANLTATGWALPVDQSENLFERVVLLTYNQVGSPEKLKLLGLAPVTQERQDVSIAFNNPNVLQSGWKITFNRLNLPKQRVRIKAWIYDPRDQKFQQLSRTRVVKPIDSPDKDS